MLLPAEVRRLWPWLASGAGAVVAVIVVGLRWHQVALWLAWFAAASVVIGWTLKRRIDASLLAAAVLLYVLFVALGEIPGQVHSLNASYRSGSHFSSFQESEREVQKSLGVDAGFIAYVSRHLPRGDPFLISPPLMDDAPQRWLQFELLPSIEESSSPCSAKWVVFYDSTAVPAGVKLGKALVFKPGYELAPVESCTS